MQDTENLGDMLHAVYEQVVHDDNGKEVEKFQTLVADSRNPLYPGYDPDHTRLSVMLKILKLKATHSWSDKSIDMMLAYLATIFLTDNLFPTSTYEAKKFVCPLALDVNRYHKCPKDCIIY